MRAIGHFPWLLDTYKLIANSYLQGQSHHAYLLIHKGEIGQQTLIAELTNLFLCKSPVLYEGVPLSCGNCRACQAHQLQANRDYNELNSGSSAVSVDSVRAMIENVQVYPSVSANNVVVINRADTLSKISANAMLKVLEEPTTDVKFLFALNNDNFIIPTIRSRCLALNLVSPTLEQIKHFVKAYFFPDVHDFVIEALVAILGYQPEVIVRAIERNVYVDFEKIVVSMISDIESLGISTLLNLFDENRGDDVEVFLWRLKFVTALLGFMLDQEVLRLKLTPNTPKVSRNDQYFYEGDQIPVTFIDLYDRADVVHPAIKCLLFVIYEYFTLNVERISTLINRLYLIERQIMLFPSQLANNRSVEAYAFKVMALLQTEIGELHRSRNNQS